jgi:hypothetical protein
MNLPCSGQAAHRFPHSRTRGHGGKKDLDFFARSGVDRLQVHGYQQRERGHLRGTGGGCERIPMPDTQQLPLRGLACVREHRADAQCLPKLAQTAQHGCLGELAAQHLPGLGSAERTFFVQRLPQFEHQG